MSKLCIRCGQPISESLKQERRRLGYLKAKATILARKSKGLQVGRPRIADYTKITELRQQGHSYSSIAFELKVSRGAVQRACKILNLRGNMAKPESSEIGRSHESDGHRPWTEFEK